MQKNQIKIVVGKGADGIQQNFYIYSNQVLGKGNFGVVKKARAVYDLAQELAVKIIPLKEGSNERAKIQSQIDVLRKIPDNPNIVRILPFKCFSKRNFYIFMEYCRDGTLFQYMQQNRFLSQQKIINIFYQIMNGYRVLWENDIVHQDIKPQNIMVHKGTMKITDFGFSIQKKKYVASTTRKGSLVYMSFQKLTQLQYRVSELDDIFSIGIIIFTLMNRKHPFLAEYRGEKLTNKQYAIILSKKAKQKRIHNIFSANLQGLYDIVLKMIEIKKQKRITCKEIYDYIDNQTIFRPYHEMSQEQTQEILLAPQSMIINEHTITFVIPFNVPQQKQQQYIQKIKEQENIKILNQKNKETILMIQKWVLNLRLVSYYFDRLARRLYIQKVKSNYFSPQKMNSYNKAILASRLFAVKVSKYILSEFKEPRYFQKQKISFFKKSQEGKTVLAIVANDQKQIEQQNNDNLKRTNQIKQNQITQLVNSSQKASFEVFAIKVQKCLKDCLAFKANLIDSRNNLVTLDYMIDALINISQVPQHPEKFISQEYFHTTETKNLTTLMNKVQEYFEQNNVEYNIDSKLQQMKDKEILQQKQSIKKEQSQVFEQPQTFKQQNIPQKQ